jgi:hypothetical protein
MEYTCCFCMVLDIWSLHSCFLYFGTFPSLFLFSAFVALSFPPLVHHHDGRDLFVRHNLGTNSQSQFAVNRNRVIRGKHWLTWWRIHHTHQMLHTHVAKRNENISLNKACTLSYSQIMIKLSFQTIYICKIARLNLTVWLQQAKDSSFTQPEK